MITTEINLKNSHLDVARCIMEWMISAAGGPADELILLRPDVYIELAMHPSVRDCFLSGNISKCFLSNAIDFDEEGSDRIVFDGHELVFKV